MSLKTYLDRRVGTKMEKDGVVSTFKGILESLGGIIETQKSGRERMALGKGGVLLVANHPAEIDVLVTLASIEERRDWYIVINSMFVGKIEKLDKHFIPVYIDHNLDNNAFSLREQIFFLFHKKKRLSKEESQERNRKSIQRAAEMLDKGALVIIYPGPNRVTGKWYKGVGHIMRQIRNKSKVSVVAAFIEGTSKWDYWRLIPGVSKLLPSFKVSFKLMGKINDIWEREVTLSTEKLENSYHNWSKGIARSKARVNSLPAFGMALVRSWVFWISSRL